MPPPKTADRWGENGNATVAALSLNTVHSIMGRQNVSTKLPCIKTALGGCEATSGYIGCFTVIGPFDVSFKQAGRMSGAQLKNATERLHLYA
jgi:hypothetical protein